jgi:hypothetical protein
LDELVEILKNSDEKPTVFYFILCYITMAMSILGQKKFISLILVPLSCLVFIGLDQSNTSHLVAILGMIALRILLRLK